MVPCQADYAGGAEVQSSVSTDEPALASADASSDSSSASFRRAQPSLGAAAPERQEEETSAGTLFVSECVRHFLAMGFERDSVDAAALAAVKARGHIVDVASLADFCEHQPEAWQTEGFMDQVLSILLSGPDNCEAQHDPEVDRSMNQPASNSQVECPICFDEIAAIEIFRLSCGHVFCSSCMLGHCSAVAFPVCPDTSCSYQLSDDEVGRAAGSERLEAFRNMQLQQAVSQLVGRVECPNPDCQNVVVCDPGVRQQVTCSCGWPSFCSCCRQQYHWNKDCSEVGMLREQWVRWVTEGRQQYHGRVRDAALALQQQTAAQESLRRQRELEEDERYKAEHCRCCPSCGRLVQKLSGCDSMKCGENYHGGDRQDGCGASFNWNSAPRYLPRITRREVPAVNFSRMKVGGSDSRHFLVACDVCGAQDIRGPRFRCVHCPDFNMCAKCDQEATGTHAAEHVFEIMFVPEQRYNHFLPQGTPVELVGLEKYPMLNLREATVQHYFPARGLYDLKLKQPFDVPDSCQEQEQTAGYLGASLVQAVFQALQPPASPDTTREVEPVLAPGDRLEVLQRLPAHFVQVCSTSIDFGQVLEAIEARREAASTAWTALPKGQDVLITGRLISLEDENVNRTAQCPHFATPESCATCRLTGNQPQQLASTPEPQRVELDAEEEPACIAGWFLSASDSVSVRLQARGGALYAAQASCVKPIVQSAHELSTLLQFQEAQAEANRLHLDLPVGQPIEILAEGLVVSNRGQTAVTTAPYDPQNKCCTVRFESDASQTMTEQQQAQAAMAQHYGVNDLLGMTAGQLVDLWDNFSLSRRGLASADDFLDRAMTFLPAVCPEPIVVSAGFVRPLLDNPEDLLRLRERHAIAQACENSLPTVGPAQGMQQDGMSEPTGLIDENLTKCSKCGEVIRGHVVQHAGEMFHFGCSPEL